MTAPKTVQPVFTGQLGRLLDAGLRVMIPKDWRSLKITEFFLISGSAEPYIKAMPPAEYEKLVADIVGNTSLDAATRNIHFRDLGSTCWRVKLDPTGRLALPSSLCAEIGVSAEKPDVILKGAVVAFEIWNPKGLANWERKRAQPDAAGKTRMSLKEYLGV